LYEGGLGLKRYGRYIHSSLGASRDSSLLEVAIQIMVKVGYYLEWLVVDFSGMFEVIIIFGE
jgi:hypothetical protein